MTRKTPNEPRRPCYIKRTLAGFAPADPGSEEIMKRHPVGTTLRADIKKPRNVKHHQLYWSMLTLICENLDSVRPETLHDLIKLRTGFVNVIRTAKGTVELPGSISFDKMDQGEFREFFDSAVDFIVTDVISGLNKDDLTRELESMIGRAAA